MNLADIPTPETDAQLAKAIIPDYAWRENMIGHSKDLERRLTVAREALGKITRPGPIMGSKDDYREGQIHALHAISKIADEALTQTARNHD